MQFIEMTLLHFFFAIKNTLSENPESNIQSVKPFKPTGDLNSFDMHIQSSGFSVNGVASQISIYGFDEMEFHQILYVFHSIHI